MNPAADFLNSLAQALSAMRLYGEKHGARQRAVDRAYEALLSLLQQAPKLVFSFLDGEVIFADEALRELRSWGWARTLARAGVERLEVNAGVPRDEFARFLAEVRRRMDRGDGKDQNAADTMTAAFPHIHFGQLGLDRTRTGAGWDRGGLVDLHEETEATGWLFAEAGRKGAVSVAVADAVVRSLALALREERNVFGLLLPLRETDEYTTVHSMNVGILSMAMAEALGHGGPFTKVVGEAALLHDVGKMRTPSDILQKPGSLSPEEWEVIKRHPVEGARILVNSRGDLELAAVVAYEHHASWSGEGYPKLGHGRRPHPVSQLIQICDVYDALRTQRPFRGPWEDAAILSYLRERAGTAFDPHGVATFAEMLERWTPVGAEQGNGTGPADPDD